MVSLEPNRQPQEWAFSFLQQKTWAEGGSGWQAGSAEVCRREGPRGEEERDQGGNQNLPCDNSGSSKDRLGRLPQLLPGRAGGPRGCLELSPGPPLSMKRGTVVVKTLGCAPALCLSKEVGLGLVASPKSSGCCSELQAPVPGRTSLLGLEHPTPLHRPTKWGQ